MELSKPKSFQHDFLPLLLIPFVFLLVVALPDPAYAQSVTEQSRKDSISITADPAYPDPGQEIKLSVSSFLVSLEGATILWKVNGRFIDEGAGVTETSYTMPADGDPITVTVIVQPARGQNITKRSTVRPATIDLVWEANTFTPSFYPGKALYSGVGEVTVTAIPFIANPSGEQYSKENLVYRWKYNNLVHGSKSGLGRNTFPVGLNASNNSISVTVSDRSGNTIGEASISIPSVEPNLLFYENHPRTGVRLNRPLDGTVNVADRETRITAYPYFFPADSAVGNSLTYQWSLGGEQVAPSRQKNEVALRDTGEDGKTNLSVEIESSEFIFPSESNSLKVTF